MSNNSVIIKSNKYGLIVILDDKIPYNELLRDVADKFKEASSFFKNAQMAITFKGRELTKEEELEIIYTITDNTDIHILCVIGQNELEEEYYHRIVDKKLAENAAKDGQFYKGTLRSGQILEVETSVIILGDVNPGANIISKGNVVILGTCKGNVYAGATGNPRCFVAALDMHPMQIRIGDCIARSAVTKKVTEKAFKMNPKIAFVGEGRINMKPITKDVLGDISFY